VSPPGRVVVVFDADGVRRESAFGMADVARRAPASHETPWPWFSITKLFTVTAAMRLAERGAIDLDAPAARWVPAISRLRPASWAARITPRHLMAHAAGIANPIPLRWIRPASEPAPDVEALAERRIAEHRVLRFRPGSKARYTNLGTLVLGAAMQRASGTPFAELVAREVLAPLAMTRTGFERPEGTAVGYHPRWNPMRWLVPRWVVGARVGRWVSTRPFLVDGPPYGGLVGPALDLVRFGRMHLRDGELDGARVLSPSSARAMRHDALGFHRAPPFVEHYGGGPGFFDLLRLDPARGVGVIVLGNATKYDIEAVARRALSA